VPGEVLPQQRRVHAERRRCPVLDDAFGDLDQDAIRAMPGIELGAREPTEHEREDDDRDQGNGLRIA
jgi:hypothetical protein